MQTWARRGVQAALVTGGMIAAGTGVASASGNCPDRPTSPLGDPLTPAEAAGDGTPSRSGLCFAGELFPENGADQFRDTVSNATADTLVGVIAPIRDIPPELDNERTQRIPRITDVSSPDEAETAEQHWIPPREDVTERIPAQSPRTGPSATLPGLSWRTDVGRTGLDRHAAPATPQPRERSRGRHAAQESEPANPADGFHRSLSWSGPIGGVVDTLVDDTRHLGGGSTTLPTALVNPETDPAVAPELGAPRQGGIISLPRQARTGGGAGVLSVDSVDLTSAGLDTGPDLRAVPRELLRSALSTRPAAEQSRGGEAEPLRLPDEVLQRAEEIPAMVAPELLVSDPASASVPAGAEGADPLGEFNALGGNVETGDLSRIARALTVDGTAALVEHDAEGDEVVFSERPELSQVVVRELDELRAAMPERQQVASNPFRERSAERGAAPAVGMALPLLDGHTYPLPALDADGVPKEGAMAAAGAWPRHAYSRV